MAQDHPVCLWGAYGENVGGAMLLSNTFVMDSDFVDLGVALYCTESNFMMSLCGVEGLDRFVVA